MRYFYFLLCFCIASISAASDLSTPESAAKAAMDAISAQQFTEYGTYMHPEALASFRKMMMEVVESAAEAKAETQLLKLFSDAPSVAALQKLNDQEFFGSFLKGVMTSVPMMKEAMSGADTKIIGHVFEGNNLAHVVTRISLTMQGVGMKKMSVISLQKDGESWKMLLTGELEGLANILKSQHSKE